MPFTWLRPSVNPLAGYPQMCCLLLRLQPGLIVFLIATCCYGSRVSQIDTFKRMGGRGGAISPNSETDANSKTETSNISIRSQNKVVSVPNVTHSGYLPINEHLQSEMFFMFYEAREPERPLKDTPILLWLQGGPGCSSLFGMLYINGPYFVNEKELSLRVNPGSWNRKYGMLFIEQPLGVGFSVNGHQSIPNNELDLATDLYKSIQQFYKAYPHYQTRRLVVTGESYAGKYVPSISHYILQAEARRDGFEARIRHPRNLPLDLEYPLFKLGGFAIGNGWTDAETQTLVTAETAWNMGLIDLAQRRVVEQMQVQVVDHIRSRQYGRARNLSDTIMEYIRSAAGSAILEDVRRNLAYDGNEGVELFLNQAHVKNAINASGHVEWKSCSPIVDHIMGHDVMKSVKSLVADLLVYYPALLYQGQFDAECGVASNDAWISTLKWSGHSAFMKAVRHHWVVNSKVAGYWKRHGTLSHVVIRNTGHMVPHDNPLYGQILIEKWVDEQVLGIPYLRSDITPGLEESYANPDQGDDACCQPDLGPHVLPPSGPTAQATGSLRTAGSPVAAAATEAWQGGAATGDGSRIVGEVFGQDDPQEVMMDDSEAYYESGSGAWSERGDKSMEEL